MFPRALATCRPIRQPSDSSQAMNHPAPPQPRAIHTPNVAKATVSATSAITRPNRAGELAVVDRSAYAEADIARASYGSPRPPRITRCG